MASECPELLSIAKLQNLKAIHNVFECLYNVHYVVINRKTTKFESNSQLLITIRAFSFCCYQSQNYKIWKQFTTWLRRAYEAHLLLSIAKLQNLKAIHNRVLFLVPCYYVVINRKTTKFESNSQRTWELAYRGARCYQSQNYKIWKQFTTNLCPLFICKLLLSIAKLQNLKAIHNSLISKW